MENVFTRKTSFPIILGVLACLFVFRLITRTRRIPKGSYLFQACAFPTGLYATGLRLPPGPPGKLIFGNALDVPAHREWETYTRWAKEYGDLVHIKVFGQSMVFINSAEVAHELFEKRSSIYSDRCEFPMLNDLMGFHFDFGFMRYGDWWRRHRRTFHQKFNPAVVVAYHDIQTRQTRDALRRLHEVPRDFATHLRSLTVAIVMEVAYGIKIAPQGDPYVENLEKAAAAMAEAANPGSFLVDAIPALKYVPEWMPGAGFIRKAREIRLITRNVSVAPFMAVKEALEAGTAEPSVLASLLEEYSDAPADQEEVIRNCAAVTYTAGGDTTVSSLNTFVLAMVLYPEAQRKAHAELDAIVGTSRLPAFEDQDSLPYISAICKEILRWNPVTPLAIAHRVTQDDVYGDYFIPEGSVVTGNAWAMLRDENVYGPKPGEFRPERFLGPGVPPPLPAFGFGRRICPGRHLAENAIFIAVASVLQVFEISHATDSQGHQIPVEPSYTSGFTSYPEPFRCSIKPRSASAENFGGISALVITTNASLTQHGTVEVTDQIPMISIE